MPSKIPLKQILVNTFGGKCMVCGYDKCIGALDFHHKNKSDKEFNISSFKKNKADQYILLKELEKTCLLCANCHREYHSCGLHKDEIENLPDIVLVEETLF